MKTRQEKDLFSRLSHLFLDVYAIVGSKPKFRNNH